MKKWVAFILFFNVLFSAVVPCSVFDQCAEDEPTEQTSDTQHKKGCEGCSPFSICSSAYAFTLSTVNTSIASVAFISSPAYCDYDCSPKSEYHSSLFQPPRAG